MDTCNTQAKHHWCHGTTWDWTSRLDQQKIPNVFHTPLTKKIRSLLSRPVKANARNTWDVHKTKISAAKKNLTSIQTSFEIWRRPQGMLKIATMLNWNQFLSYFFKVLGNLFSVNFHFLKDMFFVLSKLAHVRCCFSLSAMSTCLFVVKCATCFNNVLNVKWNFVVS